MPGAAGPGDKEVAGCKEDAMRGRKPPGPELVHRLEGAGHVKERLEVILQTLSGRLGVKEASARLGITPQRFHMLREQALQGALGALAPRPMGRPRQTPTPAQERIDALEQDNDRLQRELEASGLREEIAVLLPRRPRRGEKKRGTPPATGERAGG
jgi:transposase-like protein